MASVQTIVSPHDPRLLPYRDLKDKALAAREGLFAVEGELPVRRLLASPLSVHSLLMTPQRFASGEWPTDRCPIYLAEAEIIAQVVGFDFHRGVSALAFRPPLQPLDELQPESAPHLLVLPEINDPTNLGGLLRTAAAFGWNVILLGPSCTNPYCRRTVRTS
ncbi:MAG: RNA methyltransferase, partial [candidate division KSB1 bacterium]|nr:RNA methyltransferase [candidate division KSB1 bacterium]